MFSLQLHGILGRVVLLSRCVNEPIKDIFYDKQAAIRTPGTEPCCVLAVNTNATLLNTAEKRWHHKPSQNDTFSTI